MNTFVKNSNFTQGLKLLPLCLMLLFMVFSCNKEKEDPVLDDIGLAQLPPEIQAAKAWFDQQYASNDQEADSVSLYPVSRASENGKNGKGPNVKAKLKWTQAKLGRDRVVEVPLATTGKISYSREENPSEAQLESTVTQMIIVPREDEYVAAFMHITGDSQYLAAKGYDLSSNAYKDMVEDFTGQVFYTYLDGEYSNGWRYENGEVTHTISYQGAFGVPDIENEAPTRANSDNCIVIIVQEFFQWCTEKYIRDKDGNITDYSLTCDEWKLTGSYEYNQCSTGSGNGSGGGGGKPGAGGGSGGFLGNDDNNPPPATYTVFLELPALDVGIITGGGTYTAGATCELTAIPADGYAFTGWTGGISSSDNPHSFVVDKNYSISVVFEVTDCAGVLGGSAYEDDCGNCVDGTTGKQPCSITLSAGSPISLMDFYDLNVTLNTTVSISITSVIFYINNFVLQSGVSTSCNEQSKKAGTWDVHAKVTLANGKSLISNTEQVVVQYPDVNTIMADGIVSNGMASVWQQTKNAASSSGRSEFGFWIFANTTSMAYECGTTISGPSVFGSNCVGTGASIVPGAPGESPSISPIVGGKYAVAFFHTHTPLTYCTSGFRPTGPSPGDTSYNTVPGILYDYTAVSHYDPNTGQTHIGIIAGHNINAAAQLYTFGPNRRP